MRFYRITIFSLKLKKNSYKLSVFLKQQDTFAVLPTGYCKKHMLRVAAFDLGQGKDKYCTGYGPVPNRLPVISMSTRFHHKTVETADEMVYNVPCFFFFFFFL